MKRKPTRDPLEIKVVKETPRKPCRVCGIVPDVEYTITQRVKYDWRCKKCTNAYMRKYLKNWEKDRKVKILYEELRA